MSNVMSMKNIRNRVHRNAFDKSSKCVFSAKVGELLPVWNEEVLPGDKFKININSFTRTMPLNTAAYSRIREYYDFYFVPIRLLWRFSDNFFTQMKTNNSSFSGSISNSGLIQYTTHPYITSDTIITDFLNRVYFSQWYNYEDPVGDGVISEDYDNLYKVNELGFFRYPLTRKLLEYLGYSNNFYADEDQSDEQSVDYKYGFDEDSNYAFNPFPLLAYQKIYADYYRFSQWEDIEPWTFNIDYLDEDSDEIGSTVIRPYTSSSSSGGASVMRHTMLDLRYCNWDKGMLTGFMSSQQYGDTAYASPLYGQQTFYEEGTKYYLSSWDNDDGDYNNTGIGLSVLALRQAEFLQRWKEVSMSGNQDYKDQVEKHWGVKVPNVRSNMCQYLGGTSSSIDISEVINTNLDDSDPEIKGKGVGAVRDFIDFEAKEHGIIMCIYHAAPLVDFTSTGVSPLNTKCDFTDYAVPELDSVGMQSMPLSLLFGAGVYNSDGDALELEPTEVIGYAPRYYDYKTSVDRVRGVFNTSMMQWVTPLNGSMLYNIVQRSYEKDNVIIPYSFFKVNPSVMDYVFGIVADSGLNSDQLLVNSYFDVKAVRNLDYNGLPY